jgi:hypothetical protein
VSWIPTVLVLLLLFVVIVAAGTAYQRWLTGVILRRARRGARANDCGSRDGRDIKEPPTRE